MRGEARVRQSPGVIRPPLTPYPWWGCYANGHTERRRGDKGLGVEERGWGRGAGSGTLARRTSHADLARDLPDQLRLESDCSNKATQKNPSPSSETGAAQCRTQEVTNIFRVFQSDARTVRNVF